MEQFELNKIYNMDCLEGMKMIPDGSVDAIICDLPYGTTSCAWDTIIPFDKLWEQYKRVIKDRGPIVLFGSQPFTAKLVVSNIDGYKYDWIWDKKRSSNPQLANVQPLKNYEVISVFGKGKGGIIYKPQGLVKLAVGRKDKGNTAGETLGHFKRKSGYISEWTNFPKAILQYEVEADRFHPTQKPVDLIRYLVRTYTNEGDTVLDNCMGSGTTAIACIKENRNYIGFEMNKEYYDKSLKRIEAETNQLKLF